MSIVEQLDTSVEDPHLELVIGGAGQIATDEIVAVEARRDEYKYQLVYGRDGQITGAEAWAYSAEEDESTFTRFDATGKVVNRTINNHTLGLRLDYEGDNLVFSSHVYNDGKNSERTWYGENRQPKSSVEIDVAANTHTMTIHQPGIGDWVNVTPYAGLEGWVS
jgi:hypothetical protein